MNEKIPLARPYVGEEEVAAVSSVIRSGQLSMGQKVKEFENSFAAYLGRKYAISVNSGTSGLQLCLQALNLKPGDEVITSSFSFVASSNPIIFAGAKPVFVDIDERTFNIDPKKIEQAITTRTKAIVLVHLFGNSADMDAINVIADKYNLIIVEDACEALGTRYKDRKVGSFGAASVFAFYPNKQITTGEGGMILTDDDDIYAICDSLRNQGRDYSGGWFSHIRLGYNYRFDEMSAAVGVEQLKKIEVILTRRKEIANMYNERLKNIDGLILPHVEDYCDNSWWVYYLQLEDDSFRGKVLKYLNSNGVSAKPYFYPPIHMQPIYKDMYGFKGGEFPITEKVSSRGFVIPLFVDISDEQVDKVCTVLEKAIRQITIKTD